MSLLRRRRVAASLVFAALIPPFVPVVAADGPPTPRVVGGTPVGNDDYAFMASLQKRGGDGNPRHFCGGTLIDAEWVLTAAHCVDGLPAEAFRVVVGTPRLSAGGSVRQPVEVRVHPDYDGDATHGADIALVRLDAAVTGIRPVGPVRPADRRYWEPGDAAEVVGWGVRTESGSDPSDALERAVVAIEADDDMADAAAYGDNFVATDMLGAGRRAGGFDACRGDSGGPLLVRAGRAGLRQVGIVSFGLGCGRPGHPGVYSRLGEGRVRAFADSLIALRAEPVRASEGRVARFTLELARASTLTVAVTWETVGQSAREGTDFTGRSGVAEFRPGQTTATVDVAVTVDSRVEGEETFRLDFSTPVNVWLAAGSVAATVTDSG